MSSAAVISIATVLGSVIALLLLGIAAYTFYRWRKLHRPEKSLQGAEDVELATSESKPAISPSNNAIHVPAVVPAGKAVAQAKSVAAQPQPSPRTPTQHAQAPMQVALIRRQQCTILPTGKVSLSIQIQQEGVRVLAVEVRESQAETEPHLRPFWRPLRNVQAETWELLSFRLRQPFDMRITSSSGKQVLIRDVIKAFNQQQPSAMEPSVISVNFGSPRGYDSSVWRMQDSLPASIGTLEASPPQALSLQTPSTQPSTVPAGTPPGQRGGALADPLWRTSDTLDIPGYECDPAVLDAELEDALASQQDINTGDGRTILSTMSRISKELEDVESNPSDIVLTAASMAPFLNTRHEPSDDMS